MRMLLSISIHAPRTGSDIPPRFPSASSPRNFNPRSPHGERRTQTNDNGIRRNLFQSTLPARGATAGRLRAARLTVISIHAPRTGSDKGGAVESGFCPHFNPRSPHGERRRFSPRTKQHSHFNPRSPHGERRRRSHDGSPVLTFQSTLLARGATVSPPTSTPTTTFQSTLPARGATGPQEDGQRHDAFQSTLPARGAT